MKQIVLCPNPTRDVGLVYTAAIRDRLMELGITPTVYPLGYLTEEATEATSVRCETLDKLVQGADLLLCFGGDGTILHLARAAALHRVPILTVNLGTKGFIAEFEPEALDEIIKTAVAETYPIQERMMLDVTVRRGGQEVYADFALNDAVIAGVSRLVDIAVFGDGALISRFSGDGIIIATPTGSTAYSMSAGGPIIEPTARNLSVTPICAHALMPKSFVLAPERRVSIQINLGGGKRGYLSVDGGSFDLEDQDVIYVTQSQYVTRLVKARERNFYRIVNEKLGES